MSDSVDGSGVVMEKPSARNAGGLPRHSVQISSSWRIRLCSSPCVQLKKCERACTLSEASRFSTIDSICRKSVAAERASPLPSAGAIAPALKETGGCAGDGVVEVSAVVVMVMSSNIVESDYAIVRPGDGQNASPGAYAAGRGATSPLNPARLPCLGLARHTRYPHPIDAQ